MAVVRETAREPAGGNVKIPFRLRLKAWWEGYELEVRRKKVPDREETASEGALAEVPFERWSDPHLDFLQRIWGEGFVTPGGESYLLQLVKPFGLNPAMSLLDIGAGLGGPARLMVKTFGVWVSGLEKEPRLAEAGMALSVKAGMEKKAPITTFDPETFEGKAKSYDCIFAKDSFYTIKDKERLFETIETLLKDTGHLLFTDYVLAKPDLKSAAIKAWSAGEPDEPHPWSIEQYVKALNKYKLDVRITEDISEDFQRMVTEAWAAYLSAQDAAALDKRLGPVMVEEVELWTRRIRALESGDLSVCRIYAMRKGVGKLLSDW